MATYTLSAEIDRPYAEVVEATRAALAEQGFGVLTEIDLAATLKAKLDVDVPPQVILGACRPAARLRRRSRSTRRSRRAAVQRRRTRSRRRDDRSSRPSTPTR